MSTGRRWLLGGAIAVLFVLLAPAAVVLGTWAWIGAEVWKGKR